jgi:hypothetical protein
MGSGWDQPDRSLISIDATHALMSQGAFDQLAEYSATNPTGKYPGKMWKRHDGSFDREYLDAGGKPTWLLVWYGRHPDPNLLSINYREIVIA